MNLAQRHAALLARRQSLTDRLAAMRAAVDAGDPSVTGDQVRATIADRDVVDLELDTLQREIDREAAIDRAQATTYPAAAPLGTRAPYDRVHRVGEAERTYRPDDVQRGAPSFFRDLARAQVFRDPAASERLARHQHEVEIDRPGLADRAIGTGAVAGLVPPQYLTALYAELPRPGRPVADACNRSLPLPEQGMSVNISRITTGTSVAVQTAENAAVSETNADDTLLTVPVVTVGGQQTVSRQAIERGGLVESVLMSDLLNAHDAAIDAQVINGSGAAGQHLGILNTSGITAITYTDASPTVPEMWPKLVDAIRQIAAQRYTGATATVMNPLLWGWFLAALDTPSGRPLFNVGGANSSPNNAFGTAGGNAYQDGGQLVLTPILQSGGVPSNLGGGTNETRIISADFRDLYLWEDPNAPVFIRAEQPLAGSLGVLYVLYSYSAFTAGRQPKAVSVISGTGLIPVAL